MSTLDTDTKQEEDKISPQLKVRLLSDAVELLKDCLISQLQEIELNTGKDGEGKFILIYGAEKSSVTLRHAAPFRDHWKASKDQKHTFSEGTFRQVFSKIWSHFTGEEREPDLQQSDETYEEVNLIGPPMYEDMSFTEALEQVTAFLEKEFPQCSVEVGTVIGDAGVLNIQSESGQFRTIQQLEPKKDTWRLLSTYQPDGLVGDLDQMIGQLRAEILAILCEEGR